MPTPGNNRNTKTQAETERLIQKVTEYRQQHILTTLKRIQAAEHKTRKLKTTAKNC